MAVIPLVRIPETTSSRPLSITRRAMSSMVNPTTTPLLLAANPSMLVTVNNAVTAPVTNTTSGPVVRATSINTAALVAEILILIFFVLLLLALVPTSQIGKGVWAPLTKASREDLKLTPLDLASEYDSTAPPSPALPVTVPQRVLDITGAESIRSVSPTLVHDCSAGKEERYTELAYLCTPKSTPANSEDGHSLDHTTTSCV
ncbi:hypothetical protein C8R45DRAFT_932800 [Mycena sanguinolenta]|nr:hypothetical protein C8R45DRAFT_932800 [Mycena sanguinolenta]